MRKSLCALKDSHICDANSAMLIPAIIALTSITSADSIAANQVVESADTLVAADFDDCEICEISDNTKYDEETLFPWLFTDFARLNAEKTLVSVATSHIGLPYRRGGKTTRGFDCSGFTGYLFRNIGINLGASSRNQFKQGKEVATKDLKIGDLVFFSGRAGGTRTVGHVGMVIDVDNEDGTVCFIHSTHRSGITISRMNEPYYSSRYMGARRVL